MAFKKSRKIFLTGRGNDPLHRKCTMPVFPDVVARMQWLFLHLCTWYAFTSWCSFGDFSLSGISHVMMLSQNFATALRCSSVIFPDTAGASLIHSKMCWWGTPYIIPRLMNTKPKTYSLLVFGAVDPVNNCAEDAVLAANSLQHRFHATMVLVACGHRIECIKCWLISRFDVLYVGIHIMLSI